MSQHLSRLILAVAALSGCAAPEDSVQSSLDAPSIVTILHVNDTHSHLAPWGPKDSNLDGTLGGIARAGAIVATEKAIDPGALFVHAGDLFHGDLFFNEYLGVPELLLLQSLGLDVLVPGNHEFQFGPDFLAGVLAATWPSAPGVSIVGTNLDLSGYPALGNWIVPTVIKDTGGVKVGFFGLTTPFDPLERPAPVVIEDDLAAISQAAVDQLRADGAQVVVGLAHVGLDQSRALAQAVSGIDVIINGHDHVALDAPEQVGTTLIVSAGEYYRWVGRLRLAVTDHTELVDYQLVSVDDGVPAVPELQATVGALETGIVARYGDVYHDVIGFADEPVLDEVTARNGKRDTAIGDLFTDAYRAWTGTDIAIEANGFLDQGLPAGPIVPADVYRSMAYGLPVSDGGGMIVRPFRLATFRLSGAMLLAGLEAVLAGPSDLFPQVSGIRFDFDSRRDPGQRVIVDSVHIGGRRLALDAVYSVTANEGTLMFLPMLGVEPQDVTILADSASQAAQALIASRGTIGGGTSGRIRDLAVRGHPR